MVLRLLSKITRKSAYKITFYNLQKQARRTDACTNVMTTTKNNQTSNAKTVENNASAQAQKPRALRYVANDAAKAEMFSLKGATNSVKCAYDNDRDSTNVRAYVHELGFSSKDFKSLKWEDLQPYAVTKSGRFSTYAVICALKKYSDDKDLTGAQAAKQARKEEREKAKAAKERMQARKEAEKAAKQSK